MTYKDWQELRYLLVLAPPPAAATEEAPPTLDGQKVCNAQVDELDLRYVPNEDLEWELARDALTSLCRDKTTMDTLVENNKPMDCYNLIVGEWMFVGTIIETLGCWMHVDGRGHVLAILDEA